MPRAAAAAFTVSLAAAGFWHRLHGDDRQSAIRLDAIRFADRCQIPLGRAAIQVAFSIFVLTETWLVPVEGWFVDRFGPKIVVLIGGVLVGIAWVMNAFADSLVLLYTAAAIGGIGAGAVYGTCIGNALKWFPDRRGLCAG